MRGQAFLMIGAAVVLAAGVSLFLVSSGGGPQARPDSARRSQAARSAAEPTPPAAPESGPRREPAERRTLQPAGPDPRGVLVRGRLVMSDGSPPPAEAEVRALAGKREVDFPETIGLLGGKEAYERLLKEGEARGRVRELGGWKPGHSTRSGPDGSFEIALPRDFPEFRFEVEADFAGHFRERRFSLDSPEVLAGVMLVLDAAARIEGRLTDGSGQTVRGARVALVEPLSHSLRRIKLERGTDAESDAEGRFVFRGVAPGEWVLAAVAEGLGYAKRRVDAVPREVARADLVLGQGVAIAGKVVDESGIGVAGARVQAIPPEWTPEVVRLEYGLCRTDAEGRFRISSLEPGPHHLRATKDGLLAKDPEPLVEVKGGEETSVTLVLTAGRHVAGRVVDEAGRPVGGATVTARPDWRSARGAGGAMRRTPFSQRAETGPDGSFRLTGLGEGPYEIVASRPEVATAERRNVAEDLEDLEIVLPGPTGVAGTVEDAASGSPVRRFTILLHRIERSAGSIGRSSEGSRAFLDEEGRFRFAGLRPGEYGVASRAGGFVEGQVEGIEVAAGGIRDGLRIRMERAAAVRGKVVTVAGDPVAEALVEVGEDGMFGETTTTETAPDGSFELLGLKPGEIRLAVKHEDFIERRLEPIALVAGGAIEGVLVTLSKGGGIEGTAVDAYGKPFQGWIRASRAGGRDAKRAAIDPEGRFRMEGMESGEWTACVQHHRKVNASTWTDEDGEARPVRVEDGRLTQVDFSEREKTKRVRGRVTRSGEPVAGAVVWIGPFLAARRPSFPHKTAETGPDGTFVLEGVVPGESKVSVDAPSGPDGSRSLATFEVTVVVPADSETFLEISVPTGGIEGRVRASPADRPLFSAAVEVEPLSMEETGRCGGSARTDRDGRFRLPGLPAGTYRVRARAPEDDACAPAVATDVVVADGALTTVDFDLQEEGRALVEVVDERGEPVREAWVVLRRVEEEEQLDPRGTPWVTDSAGLARMRRISPGTYYASAGELGGLVGFSDKDSVLPGRETRFRIRLVGGVEARVAVLDPEGQAVAEARVSFLDAEKRRVGAYLRDEEGAPPERRAARARLAAGEYLLRVSAEGFRAREQTVEVAEPSPWEIVVRLEREAPR
ncbi:MAG: carboxypeptidase-like regulatory domain-containing protein [Planctomycetes bacterium]|nr:carboxypeptidase-like regulatory domain-containing protein [Planctomycetota bacterium]